MLETLRGVLKTRRRWKVAMLGLAHHLSQREIAKRLKISQPTVHRELQVIEQVKQEIREQEQAKAIGTACLASPPSLN